MITMQWERALKFLLITICSVCYVTGHLIDGIFTEPTLQPGYNLVTTVPKGAKALNITELSNTENILAVRRQNRRFVLNGNSAMARSGSFEAAGTTFTYTRQDSHYLESVAAEGPLQEPVDILVFYKEPNPGIVYRYVMLGDQPVPPRPNPQFSAATSKTSKIFPPSNYSRRKDFFPVKNLMAGDEAHVPQTVVPQRRLRKRRFSWKSFGLTDCNKFCGGGIQVTRFICVREQSQGQVPERRCHHLEKPVGQSIRCNTRPCPAKWRAGAWSQCSVSCGDGFRSRELECVQEVTPTLTMRVADGACIEPKLLPVKEACAMSPCETRIEKLSTDEHVLQKPRWNAEPWSECSASCGPGKKTRVVSCLTTARPCLIQEKPVTEEACNLSACIVKSTSSTPVHSNANSAVTPRSKWLYTEWSHQCSADCGTGVQWRRVVCGSSATETCDETMKPKTSQECVADTSCSGHWFAGPWTRCSAACENGEQTREVVCVAKIRGSLHVALDMNCPVEKPEIKRHCRGSPCPAAWFASDWSECTRSCGKGMQQREVKCLESDGRIAEAGRECTEADRPVLKRVCNEQPCKNSVQDGYGSDGGNRVIQIQIQNDPEISNGLDENPGCRDTNFNCPLVVQARLYVLVNKKNVFTYQHIEDFRELGTCTSYSLCKIIHYIPPLRITIVNENNTPIAKIKDCKDEWRKLRDGYRRVLTRRETKSGQSASKCKPWKFEAQMSFIANHFIERDTLSNISNSGSTPTSQKTVDENEVHVDDGSMSKDNININTRGSRPGTREPRVASPGRRNPRGKRPGAREPRIATPEHRNPRGK